MVHMTKLTRPISPSAFPGLAIASNSYAETLDKLGPLISVRWNDVGDLILGHQVTVALPSGELIAGKVFSIHSDSLDLQALKTSDSEIQQKAISAFQDPPCIP